MADVMTLTIKTAEGTRTGEFVPVGIHRDGQGNTMCNLVRPHDPQRIIVSGYCLQAVEPDRFAYGVRSSPRSPQRHRDAKKTDAPQASNAVLEEGRSAIGRENNRASATVAAAASDHAAMHAMADAAGIVSADHLAADAASPADRPDADVDVGRAAPDATESATDAADITDGVHVPTHSIPATFSGFWYCVDLLNVLVRCYHASPASRVNGVRGMFQMLAPIIGNPTFPRSGVVFAGEGGHAVRRAIYPAYKSHRPETPELLRDQIALAIEAVQQLGWPVLSSPGYEADDVLAALALTISARGGEPIIVSSDKDLRQLLAVDGVHVMDPGSKALVYPAAVREKFGVDASQLGDWLALTGDASDGVPGVTGIGPAAATELLTDHHTLDGVLSHAVRMRAIEPKKKRWQTLVEQSETARLSRELVRLRTECPLPGGWWDWPVDTPCPNWQDWFRAKGLSAVIDTVSRVTGLPAAHPRHLTPIPTSPSVISVSSVTALNSSSMEPLNETESRPESAGPDCDVALPAESRSESGPEESAAQTPATDRIGQPSDAADESPRPRGAASSTVGSVVSPAAVRLPESAPQFVRDCIAAGLTITAGPDQIVGNYSARTPDGRAWVLMPALPPRPDLIVSDQFESITLAQFREQYSSPLSIHHGDTESTEKPLTSPAAAPRDLVPTFRTQSRGALF